MRIKCFVTSVVVLFLAAQLALASGIPVGVGNNPPTVFPGDPINGVEVGDAANPIQIFLDPGAPFWPKTFEIDVTGVGLATGAVIPVWEHIQLIPPPPTVPFLPLTDWHEEIHTPDWEWEVGELILHDVNNFVVPGVVGGPLNNLIWFEWGFPVFPPQDIWIHKELVYLGPNITPDPTGQTIVRVDIWEHPTVPEPSTVVLAGLGALVLGLVALRRRRT